jgi:hypothetical protein
MLYTGLSCFHAPGREFNRLTGLTRIQYVAVLILFLKKDIILNFCESNYIFTSWLELFLDSLSRLSHIRSTSTWANIFFNISNTWMFFYMFQCFFICFKKLWSRLTTKHEWITNYNSRWLDRCNHFLQSGKT